MRTNFYVKYDLFDTTAAQDAIESAENNQPFADIKRLKNNAEIGKYTTLEHNFFTLDGSCKAFPDNPEDVAYLSDVQALESGYFIDDPVVKIKFTEKHSSVGLTLLFADFPPLEIEVTWKDLNGTLLSVMSYYPDSIEYFCENQVEDYGSLEICFIRCLPGHFAKLQGIKYGKVYNWDETTVKSGKIVSETDPTSNQIKTDKLTFTFIDAADEFNIGNLDGLHRVMQKRQHMSAYMDMRGKDLPMMLGNFFCDTVKTASNITTITAIDAKGMLAKSDFLNGRVYSGELAGDIIAEIMEAAGITDYTIDEVTMAMPLYGTLKIQTCQKALREVLFACGAIMQTSRRAGIEINQYNRDAVMTIRRTQKFSTSITVDPYVSDVTVNYNNWSIAFETSEIDKGEYGPGTHTIQFSSPVAELSISAGTIVDRHPYWITFNLPADVTGEVVISGKKYTNTSAAATASIQKIKSGETRNSKTFSGTLLNYEAASRVAAAILDYYQLQQIIQTQEIGDAETSGAWAEIENPVKEHGGFLACMESVTMDLTGGFVITAKSRGYYKIAEELYYNGELYAGDEVGII